MKRRTGRIAAGCLAAVMAGALGVAALAGCAPQDEAVSYVQVDVNPSVALSLDAGGSVLSVYAENEDAQVLLYGEDLVGMDAEQALEKIAELSVELGYLDRANCGVDVLVEGRADEAEITAFAQAAFTAATEPEGFAVQFTSEGTFTLNRERLAANAAYGLDLGAAQFSLILSAQAADRSLTIEAAAEMDTEELIAIVNEAAKQIEPYATAAYGAAVRMAQNVYETGKNSLLVTPYLLPYANFLRYPVNNGMIYNLYVNAYGALDTALIAAEEAEALAQSTSVPQPLRDAVADALQMSAEEEAAFAEAAVTFAEMNDWLDGYIKNKTAEERAALRAQIEAAMEEVQAFADTVEAGVSEEYKEAFGQFCADIENIIPVGAETAIKGYVEEFEGLAEDLTAALSAAKEPKAALYAARNTFKDRADQTLETIRDELSAADRKVVDAAVDALEEGFTALENTFRGAVEEAEQAAREALAALRAAREEAQGDVQEG